MDCVGRHSDQDNPLGRTRLVFFYGDQARRAADVLRPVSRKVWLEDMDGRWRVRALVRGDANARARAELAALKAAYPKEAPFGTRPHYAKMRTGGIMWLPYATRRI